MFEYNIQYVEKNEYDNLVLSKKMEVGNLHIFLILDTLDKKIADLLINKITDLLVENLDEKDVYNSFSNSLEKINKFLREIRNNDDEEKIFINLLLGVLDNNGNLYFSKIGKASVYLVRSLNEISEITDKQTKFEEFTFVSSGKLEPGDLIFFANKRLLNYLAKSDLIEVWDKKDLVKANLGLTKTLTQEKTKSNISFIALKFFGANDSFSGEKEDSFIMFLMGKIKDFFNKLIKYFDKYLRKNKYLKNILLVLGIIISIYILYFFVNKVLNIGGNSGVIKEIRTEISQAKKYINSAGKAAIEGNKELFKLNIDKATEIKNKLIEKKLLKDDVAALARDISMLKKEFNNVIPFVSKPDNKVTEVAEKNIVKMLTKNGKVYVIGEDKIIGPIISGEKPKRYIFNEISKKDKFIDAVVINSNILLLTDNNRIVKFSADKTFSYIDVSGQQKWEDAKIIKNFGRNIYLVERKTNQIYKHSYLTSNSYSEGKAYIPKDDLLNIGKILAIGIDGGFYILRENLTMKKFFKKNNRLESLRLDKLPTNYNWDKKSKIDIVLDDNLRKLYLFMNNKIWFFKIDKPNDKDNVKVLTYIGQIEAEKYKIKSFVVNDNEILIVNEKGVYRIIYNVKNEDGKYILKIED